MVSNGFLVWVWRRCHCVIYIKVGPVIMRPCSYFGICVIGTLLYWTLSVLSDRNSRLRQLPIYSDQNAMLCECRYWMWLIIHLRSKSTHLPTVASCDVDITYAIYVAQIYPPGRPCLCTCSGTFANIGVMAPIYGVARDIRLWLWWLPRILSDGQVLYIV